MDRRQVLVIGNGMVGQRFVDQLVAADTAATCAITVIGEESRPAYDRVALSSWFNGKSEEDLRLVRPRAPDRRSGRLPVRAARRGDRPPGRQGDPRRRIARRLRRTRDRDGFVPVRPSRTGPRPRGMLRLPHARRSRTDPHVGHRTGPHHGPRDRRRAARPRSGQRAQGPRPRRPRRGDGAVPDAPTARRGRGTHARPLGRFARRRSALRRRARPVPGRRCRQRDRPADGRRDDPRLRHRGVLRRRPPS